MTSSNKIGVLIVKYSIEIKKQFTDPYSLQNIKDNINNFYNIIT